MLHFLILFIKNFYDPVKLTDYKQFALLIYLHSLLMQITKKASNLSTRALKKSFRIKG
jgi:hypothetical protein